MFNLRGAPLWLAESDNPDDLVAYIEENPDSASTALARKHLVEMVGIDLIPNDALEGEFLAN